ncbi:MAG: phospholipase D-like domain-containing protein [Deltaproteobacteria bacterium]|nr:phospholipase D-like domain-containing protein [Deltaproteobacteria bacterium]
MKIVKSFFLFCLLASILSICNGCATLPNVSEMIDEAPTAQKHPQIVSSKGLLSPQKSKAIMERLKRSADPTDILERHNAVVESITDSPLTKGNKVTLLADGQAAYAAMFKAIEKAKDHINLETFIIEDDETGRKFADLLLQKQAEGVQVNLIYDSVGSMNTPASFFQHLHDGGVQIVGFNPINPLKAGEEWDLTHRDHRKILIVDGKVAIIGGINISKVYSSIPLRRKQNEKAPIHWRDTDVQIEGPTVAEFQKLFFDTWLQQKGPKLSERNYFPVLREEGKSLVRVVGSTPGETNRIPFIVYVSAISFAEHSIHMTNSYFIPDDQIVKALTDAAARGVDVKIILPGISDSQLALQAQRYHYSELLQSGVKIYERNTSLLHAKTAVIDEVWSTVGSTNMDFLSLLKNDEVNAVILSHEFAVEMEQMFARDLADSRQILWEEWEKRPLLPRAREWFVNLFFRWL